MPFNNYLSICGAYQVSFSRSPMYGCRDSFSSLFSYTRFLVAFAPFALLIIPYRSCVGPVWDPVGLLKQQKERKSHRLTEVANNRVARLFTRWKNASPWALCANRVQIKGPPQWRKIGKYGKTLNPSKCTKNTRFYFRLQYSRI